MKSKYESHILPNLDKIRDLLEKGATIKDVAASVGVAYSVLRKYLAAGEKGDLRYKAFADAFAKSKEVADKKVENALFRRACGYDYEEHTYERKKDENGDVTMILTKTVIKHLPPDPTTAMFWVTNRMPDKYKYRNVRSNEENNADGDGGGIVEIPAVMPAPEPPAMEDGDA